jgi:apolipoprotein N-acyltransferase
MHQKQIAYPIKDRWSFIWLAIGIILMFFPAVPLTHWLAPIFVLRFIRTQKTWRALILVWFLSFVASFVVLREILPAPLPDYLMMVFFFWFFGVSFAYMADRLLVPRLQRHGRANFLATLVFPLAVTSLEYIGALFIPIGGINSQAYHQYNNLALIQLLSITGIWGITFLVNWLGPVVNWAWERSFEWKEIRQGAAFYAAVLILVIGFGGARMAFSSQPTSTVRVHGITMQDMQTEMPKLRQLAEDDWQAYRQLTAELREPYLEATVREARAGAQLVFWPEMAVFVPGEDEAEFFRRAVKIARQEGIYLAMPMLISSNDGALSINKIVILDPAGDVVLEHLKYGNAVEEGLQPGDGVYQTIETPFGTLSGVVCNDADHQEVVTQAGRNGTDILLVPLLEYRGLNPLHSHMTVYRAIENGIVIVRQSDNGPSLVADPYGRVLASMDYFATTERVMVAQVPSYNVPTLYSYTPDLFAWLAIAGFATLVIAALVQRWSEKRIEASQPEPQSIS